MSDSFSLRSRLLFAKEGRAAYISHLDLMRTFQRVFARAGVALRHSEGFNPHPLLSIALPLSVGQESVCELLDFEPTRGVDALTLPERLNAALPEGIRALRVLPALQKPARIKWIEVAGTLYYDAGVPDDALTRLRAYFGAETLVLAKKTKRGTADFDLKTGFRDIHFSTDGVTVTLRVTVSAQNPTVNPALFFDALQDLPGYEPDFARFRREEILDENLKVFR
jgi:radical SAM-linked protein